MKYPFEIGDRVIRLGQCWGGLEHNTVYVVSYTYGDKIEVKGYDSLFGSEFFQKVDEYIIDRVLTKYK